MVARMHFQAPAAAVLCAILVAILLGPVAVSPGPGLWMVPVAAALILLGAIWKLVDLSRARAEPPPREQMQTPFGAGVPRAHAARPGFYGPQGGLRQPLREERPAGVHAAFIPIIAGIMFSMVYLGVIFAEGTEEIASGQAAAAAEEAEFEEADGAEQPAASPERQAEPAERETDDPPPTPAVTQDASPAQVAAARAAAEAAEESEEDAAAREPAGNGVQEATPVEMQEDGDGEEEEVADPVEEPQPREYVVQQGDSLYGIAQAHDLLMRELMEWNPTLSPSSLIHPGETLILPPLAGDELVASTTEEDSPEEDSSDEELMTGEEEDDLLLEE